MSPILAREGPADEMPAGKCVTSRRDGHLWVERADSRVLVSLELLDAIVGARWQPEVTIRLRDESYCGPGMWLGAVIRMEAANRTVVYRLTGQVADGAGSVLGYIAEWPD